MEKPILINMSWSQMSLVTLLDEGGGKRSFFGVSSKKFQVSKNLPEKKMRRGELNCSTKVS